MRSPWSDLAFPGSFLDESLRAPIPLPSLGPADVRRALERVLERIPIPPGASEAALSAAAGLLHGCETLLSLLHELLDPAADSSRLRDTVRDVLRLFRLLLEHAKSSYSLEQIAQVAQAALVSAGSSATDLPRLRRLKDFMSPLEERLMTLGLASRMDPERLGKLLVHLDDLYDDAALMLQRFACLAIAEIGEAVRLLPALLRRLYQGFVRGSISDHIQPLYAVDRTEPGALERPDGEVLRGEEGPEPPESERLLPLLQELEAALANL